MNFIAISRKFCVALLRVVITTIIIGSYSQLQAEGLIESRATKHPTCQLFLGKLSQNGLAVWQSLCDEADRLGRMPSLAEYSDLLITFEGPFTQDDRSALFFCFGVIQRPSISKEDLYKLLRAQRASLSSFRASYETEYKVVLNTENPVETPYHRKCIFAFDNQKIMLDNALFRKGAFVDGEIEAYDGKVLRTLLINSGRIPSASIAKLKHRSRFYNAGNPIQCSGLFNSIDEWGYESNEMDDLGIRTKSGFVYETPVTIRGIECISVGNVRSNFSCSPKHKYVLVESRIGEIYFDKTTHRYLRRNGSVVRKNSDFIQISDQLWLPKKSEHIHKREGRVVNNYATTVDSYKINEKLPEELFAITIPEGASVMDAVQGRVYVFGKEPVAIQEKVKENPKARQ